MKKIILSTLSVLAVASIIFISCKSKNDDDALAPTYKDSGAGTGGNTKPNDVTTTGTIVTTGNMSSSTMYSIGIGSSWQSSGCSGQTCLEVSNPSGSNTTVTICFLATPVAGSYQLVSSMAQLTPTTAFMKVRNPTGQDLNSEWYSTTGGGTVYVTVNAPSITATFTNIACYRPPNSFYTVTVSGQVGCL